MGLKNGVRSGGEGARQVPSRYRDAVTPTFLLIRLKKEQRGRENMEPFTDKKCPCRKYGIGTERKGMGKKEKSNGKKSGGFFHVPATVFRGDYHDNRHVTCSDIFNSRSSPHSPIIYNGQICISRSSITQYPGMHVRNERQSITRMSLPSENPPIFSIISDENWLG